MKTGTVMGGPISMSATDRPAYYNASQITLGSCGDRAVIAFRELGGIAYPLLWVGGFRRDTLGS